MALAGKRLSEDCFRLRLAADPLSVRAALGRIVESGPVMVLSPDQRATAEIVLAEVLNNIAEHAYAPLPGEIEVALLATPVGLDCRIADRGRAMPDGVAPVGGLPEDRLPEGGFGWFLIRSLTLGLTYQRVQGQNLLRFVIPG